MTDPKERICQRCGDSVSPRGLARHMRYHRLEDRSAYQALRPAWPHVKAQQ